MQFFKYALVLVVCVALIDFTEAWRLRRVFRKIGRAVKKVGKAVKKVGCKVLFGVGCPVAVGAAGTAIGAGSGGIGGAAAGAAVAIGINACHVRKEKCRRSVLPAGEILLPFSDVFSDFDLDGDKRIYFEEFVISVMKTMIMADPEELFEPFIDADADASDYLDEEEFMVAPLLFKHVYHPGQDDVKPGNASNATDFQDIIPTNAENATSPAA